MHILVIGDVHFKPTKIEALDSVLKEITSHASNYCKHVGINKLDLVVGLGDWLDEFGKVVISAHVACLKFMKNLANLATHGLVALVGNHDREHNRKCEPNMHFFTSVDSNIHMVDRGMRFVCNGVTFGALPYLPAPDFIPEAELVMRGDTPLVNFDNSGEANKPCVIFGHQEIRGCLLDSGIVSNSTTAWPADYPLLISGHIHKLQWINKNVFYPGTPLQHNRGESQEKYVLFASINDVEEPDLQIIQMVTVPRIHVLNVNSTDDLLSFIPRYRSGDTVRLRIPVGLSITNPDCLKFMETPGVTMEITSKAVVKKETIVCNYSFFADLCQSSQCITDVNTRAEFDDILRTCGTQLGYAQTVNVK